MNKADYRHILSKLCTPIKFDEFIDSSIDTETRHHEEGLGPPRVFFILL